MSSSNNSKQTNDSVGTIALANKRRIDESMPETAGVELEDMDNVRIPAHFRFCSSLRC